MLVIGLYIQKGGVGKTSLSGNLAYAVSRMGKRVLLVDADPQGNLSSWLLQTPSLTYEMADLLSGEQSFESVVQDVSENLSLLPTIGTSHSLKNFGETRLVQRPFSFDDMNQDIANAGFDICIYDMSPGLSLLERCALLSLNEVITPMLAEFFSIDGLETLTQTVVDINASYRRQVHHKRLIVNAIHASFRRHRDALPHLEHLGYHVYKVPQDVNVAESQYRHLPLSVFNSKARALPEIQRLAQDLIQGV